MPIELNDADLMRLLEAEQLVRTFNHRLASVPVPAEPGSDLAVDEANTPQIVHPAQTSKLILTNVNNCLLSAITLCKAPGISGVSPVEILLRTALIGSCRAMLIVVPDDPLERQAHAVDIAHADFHSANRAWSVMGKFEHTIENASKAQTLFEGFFKEFPSGRAPADGGLIARMIKTIEGQFQDPVDGAFMREQLLTIWHGYSGVAHANTWQHSLSGMLNGASDSVTTGPLFHHLGVLARAADYSVEMLEQRTRARA